MYYGYFGLNQAPFKITPDTDFFFSGGNRGPILEALLYAITSGEGMVKVTGEVGSGKTTLCAMLRERLPPHIETIYLLHPPVTPEEILHACAFELQLGIDRTASRLEVIRRLQQHLLERHAEGKRVVMFVEESQGLPLETLEEIRLLSNLETRADKLLQIVLFGQPELDENLNRPSIRQLRERISHAFGLGALDAAQTRDYLMFRLSRAGYCGTDLFSPGVVRRIARASQGLTRRINLIADKTLLAAFSENSHTVRLRHVNAALNDSEFGRCGGPRPRTGWAIGYAAMGLIGGTLLYALIQGATDASVDRYGQAQTHSSRAQLPKKSHAANPPTEPLPMTASVSRQPDDGERGLVNQRFAASDAWLQETLPATYSIQLMSAEDNGGLTRQLDDIARFVEVKNLFLYRTIVRGKAWVTVLYGNFQDRRAAERGLEALPTALKTYQPILRTVRSIRAEIRRIAILREEKGSGLH